MIQVLDRAFTVLERIAGSEKPLSLHSLAEGLGISTTNCANLLKTLMVRGYVEQENRGGGYSLGPMAFGLSLLAGRFALLARVADPIVHEVAEKTGETTLLAVLSGQRRLILAHAETEQAIRFSIDKVLLDDLHATATGHVLLACAGDRQLRSITKRLGKKLTADLEAIRRDGRSIRRLEDTVQISFPVTYQRRVIAAIGSFIPRFRCDEGHEAHVVQALIRAVGAIERELAKMTDRVGGGEGACIE